MVAGLQLVPLGRIFSHSIGRANGPIVHDRNGTVIQPHVPGFSLSLTYTLRSMTGCHSFAILVTLRPT